MHVPPNSRLAQIVHWLRGGGGSGGGGGKGKGEGGEEAAAAAPPLLVFDEVRGWAGPRAASGRSPACSWRLLHTCWRPCDAAPDLHRGCAARPAPPRHPAAAVPQGQEPAALGRRAAHADGARGGGDPGAGLGAAWSGAGWLGGVGRRRAWRRAAGWLGMEIQAGGPLAPLGPPPGEPAPGRRWQPLGLVAGLPCWPEPAGPRRSPLAPWRRAAAPCRLAPTARPASRLPAHRHPPPLLPCAGAAAGRQGALLLRHRRLGAQEPGGCAEGWAEGRGPGGWLEGCPGEAARAACGSSRGCVHAVCFACRLATRPARPSRQAYMTRLGLFGFKDAQGGRAGGRACLGRRPAADRGPVDGRAGRTRGGSLLLCPPALLTLLHVATTIARRHD